MHNHRPPTASTHNPQQYTRGTPARDHAFSLQPYRSVIEMGSDSIGNNRVFPLPGKPPKTLPDVVYWHPDPRPLSQDVIQHGCSYTPKVKNEHASCGGPNMMVPLLKHWTALPALSYFLTNSMHIRESSRRIVVPSTFKPPPRVTLTDTKRELWLKDLSNPEYPLRKLGRTIPHGLKGAVLLEQMYLKKIPLFRALWLIKCIGASELRTLKRKMTASQSVAIESAENIWLREWTEDVLGYFEQTIMEFDDTQEWGNRNCYLLDTVAGLFSEGLINHSILMNWVLDNLESGPAKLLPTLVYLANKIWSALVQEQAAVRLARAICARTCLIPDAASYPKTLHVVDALLLRLFVACPDAFISPEIWSQLEAQLKRATTLPALFTKVTRNKDDLLDEIEVMSQRNAIFTVSGRDEKILCKQWRSAMRVDKVLSNFTTPFSVPELASQLKSLGIPLAELFNSLITWTLRRANDRATHLCIALCQHLAATSTSPLDDYLVNFLIKAKQSQCGKPLFNLLAWLYKAKLFSVEKYLRRLIGSGILHVDGNSQQLHREILRNLPFSFMNRTLRSQMKMLLHQDIEDPHVVMQLADQVDAAVYDHGSNNEPQAIKFPENLHRDEELRLADLIFERYKSRLVTDPDTISPLHLSAVAKCIDNLSDKYTTFKLLWISLSRATTQALFRHAHSMSMQYLFYFICMRVTSALIQIQYERRSYFTVPIPHSFETSNIVMMLRSANQVQPKGQLLDSFLKSIESLHATPTATMTPESLDDDQIDGTSVSELVSRALDSRDRATLLKLRNHFPRQHTQFMTWCSKWLTENHDMDGDFIAWCIASFFMHFSDVYNALVDRCNDLLYDLIFRPVNSFKLEPLERDYLFISRQIFTLFAPTDELLYILSGITDCTKFRHGINEVLQRVRYNSDRCSDMLFGLPESPDKMECMRICVQQQVGVSFDDGITTPESRLLYLLEACSAFNTGFCQIGAWLNFLDASPAQVAELVLNVLNSGKVPQNTASWQVIFALLSDDAKCAIRQAAEKEFLTGPVPNPGVDHLLLILPTLGAYATPSARTSNHCGDLIHYVGLVTEACKTHTVTSAEIKTTLVLLLKLIVIECTPKETDSSMEAEYSKVILPTLAALCLGLQQSPVVEESSELSSMVADALRILNRHEDINATSFNVLQSSLGGLMMYSRSQDTYSNLEAWPFDLIEENASGSGNDVPLDLSRFETYVELKDSS